MTKKFGHTGTLFFEHGKYRWSYKYNHCKICKTCDYKHKGRGLCTSCWDKERANNPKRKQSRKNAVTKRHQKTYKPVVTKKITREYRSKVIQIISNKKEIKKKAGKKYYENNKIFLRFQDRLRTMKRKGKIPIKIIISGEIIEIPFETLERPKTTLDPGYKKWEKAMHEIKEFKKYFLHKKILKNNKNHYNTEQ